MHNHHHHIPPLRSGHDRLRRFATYASVSVAALLIIAKLAAYLITDSVAMMSSLLDSTVDFLASLVTVYGIANALRPPDRDHRFGHGKAESLAALTQAAFIIGSAAVLVYEAISRFYTPHAVHAPNVGYGVMALATVLTAFLLWFQRYVIKRTRSMAINADRLHYAGDFFINLAVVAALGLEQLTGITWLDPVFAILIAAGLAVGALRIAREALNVLMDHELPEEDRSRIAAIIMAHPNVLGMHDLRTRSDSDRVFIEFHLELPPAMTIRTAHDIADSLMIQLREHYPDADILVHQDPAGVEERRLDREIEAGESKPAM